MKKITQLFHHLISEDRFYFELLYLTHHEHREKILQAFKSEKYDFLIKKYNSSTKIKEVLSTHVSKAIAFNELDLLDRLNELKIDINLNTHDIIVSLYTNITLDQTIDQIDVLLDKMLDLGFNLNQTLPYASWKKTVMNCALDSMRLNLPHNSTDRTLSFDYFEENPEKVENSLHYQLFQLMLKKGMSLNEKIFDKNYIVEDLKSAMQTRSLRVVKEVLKSDVSKENFDEAINLLQSKNVTYSLKEKGLNQLEKLFIEIEQEKLNQLLNKSITQEDIKIKKNKI
jgi:hypothetical protein